MGRTVAVPVLCCAALAGLVGLAGLLPGARAQCGGVPAKEAYDDNVLSYVLPAAVTKLSCNGFSDGSLLEVVQLFTPSTIGGSVPFKYSSVCIPVRFDGLLAQGRNHNVTAVLYEDAGGVPAQSPSYSSTATLTFGIRGTVAWLNVDGLSFVATRPRVFLGVRIVAPCAQLGYVASYVMQPAPRLSFRRDSGGSWLRHMGDWATDNATAVAVRAKGSNYADSPSPPGWSCAPARYTDAVCDCKCGLWDPACSHARAGPVSPNCSAGQVCDRNGLCIDPHWDTRVCRLESYGSGDGCDCGCGGALDPDCRDSTAAGGPWYPPARNCPRPQFNVARCSDAGQCVEAWPNCSASAYNDSARCDCRCQAGGVLDPDCVGASAVASDCGDSKCFEYQCRAFPAKWKCAVSAYADSTCDCKCGAVDIDCRDSGENARNCDTSAPTCDASALCIPSLCGNGVAESGRGEECDGGSGCKNCTCDVGWTSTVPPTPSCLSECGDYIVVGTEQCDGGAFCSGTCTCTGASTPYANPPQRMCKGCNNGVLDADIDEECDGGTGCLDTCKCMAGFVPDTPKSIACAQVFQPCGDLTIESGEECDGGALCNVNCTCSAGSRPYSSPLQYCKGCGNGQIDDGEQCDGGVGCNHRNCTCVAGYVPSNPLSTLCQKIQQACGDHVVSGAEQCDGGRFCDNDNCTCMPGHPPVAPQAAAFCQGCGNQYVDAGEQCDGGAGCTHECTCASGFHPTSPTLGLDCEEETAKSKDKDNSVAVGVPIGVTGFVLVCAMGAVLGFIFTIRRKEAPSTIVERPVDDNCSFVAANDQPGVGMNVIAPETALGGLGAMSGSSGAHAYVHSHTADGVPVVVVPVPGAPYMQQHQQQQMEMQMRMQMQPEQGCVMLDAGAGVDPLVLASLSGQLQQIAQSVQAINAAQGSRSGGSAASPQFVAPNPNSTPSGASSGDAGAMPPVYPQ
eukprot:m51a1_g14426 putative serine-threonine protein (959) ;mRNA; f:505037-508884